MSKLLITGASGLLGANLALAAHEAGMALALQYQHFAIALPGAQALAVDLTSDTECAALFAAAQPTVVIHCAAAADVDWCERNPAEAERANVQASGLVARECARSGAFLIYISTDAVYAGTATAARQEGDALPPPLNQYTRTKLLGEVMAARAQPHSLIVRTVLYGWGTTPARGKFGEGTYEKLRQGGAMSGFGDAVFSPLYAGDLAQILLKLQSGKITGVLNIGSSAPVTKYAFLRGLAAEFVFDEQLVSEGSNKDVAFAAPRPTDIGLDCRKAQGLGIELLTWQASLAAMHTDLRNGWREKLRALAK